MDFKEKFLRNLVKNWYKFFGKLGISAEFLTLFRVAFGIITALILINGVTFLSLSFLIIYQFILLFDYIDGELARYQKRFSLKWVYLDRIFHYIITVLLIVSLAISTHSAFLIYLSTISVLSFLILGLIDTKNSDLRLNKNLKERKIDKYEKITGLFIIESPFSLFFFLVLFNFVKITIVLYSCFYLLGFIYKSVKMINSKKPKEIIKKELAEQYYGEESQKYDEVRASDPRRAYIVQKQTEITKQFLSEPYKNILDVACGTGRFFYLYKGKIYGIDISTDQLKEAKRKNKKAVLKVSDAEKISYPSNKFDVTSTSQFIMHIPNYREVIKEMTRVTKKRGIIIIDFPNRYSISNPITKLRLMTGKLRHYNLFSYKDIEKIAKENNLIIEKVEPTVVISPMFFPKSLLKLSSYLNNFLIKVFPRLTYVYYIKFRKI